MKRKMGGNPVMHNKFRRHMMPLMLTVTVTLLLQACSKRDLQVEQNDLETSKIEKGGFASNKTVMDWNEAVQLMYTLPLNVGSPPPVLSRSFAMIQVAMHDALNAVTPRFETYAYKGPVDKKANHNVAVTQAAYRMIQALKFPWQNIDVAENLYLNTMASIPEGDDKTRGIAIGNAVADAMLSKRSADNPLLAVVGHPSTPANGTQPGEFRYLPPLNYALAGFDKQATWVINSSSQFRPATIYGKTNVTEAVATPQYTVDYEELRDYGRLNNSLRTPDQSEIGVFWAENSSRGWNLVARQVISSRPGNSTDAWKTARLLALVHIAIADSYIAVFDAKIHFNFWRPISGVRLGDFDGNPQTIGEGDWQPVLFTPAVGEFPSAHAISGAAAGAVLIDFFNKDNYTINMTSGYMPNVIRQYNSIRTAVHDNSLSRIYIGYHFRHAIEIGESMGYDLGRYVYQNGLPEK